LRAIPFRFFSPDGDPSPAVHVSPMLDLANENMAHYRTSADYENTRHLTGCPTPVVADEGAKTSTEDIKLGGRSCLKLGTGGTAFFLGLTGAELQAQAGPLREHKENMALLGSRLLEPQREGVEAAETHLLRQSGENATLVDIALSVAEGWTQVLRWMAWWTGEEEATVEDILLTLSTDFLPKKMDPSMLQELISAVQSNKMSLDSFLWNLKEGELWPPERDVEEEKQLLEQDRASDLGIPPTLNGANPED
jgi:hypothetical protein